jgi:Mg2+-importing ATPase
MSRAPADAQPATELPFWTCTAAEALTRWQSRPTGLTATEAAERLRRDGPNRLAPVPQQWLLLAYLKRFGDPLVIILLLASSIEALTGDVAGFGVIAVIVLISVTLDFVQEHRAQKAAEALRQSVAVQATVRRGGQQMTVLPAQLVPGDIVLLCAGDLVPADGLILAARNCYVNQALLTGEPYPVEKQPLPTPTGDGTLMQAPNAVCMGTSMISGSAEMLVCATGPRTALGNIAHALLAPAPPTAFEKGTRQFGLLIMRLTVLLVLFVVLVNLWLHRPLLESFLFAVALAVGLTPELLPMIVSVTLARGAIRLSRAKVIIKRLSAIEDLGAMDVLCTDKTGTLTEARIRLERHIDPQGRDSERVLELAYRNSYFESGLRSPLDDAILAHEHLDVSGWHKIDEVPFDFERRRVSVLVDDGHARHLIVKGAPEDILPLCRDVEQDGGTAPLTDAARQEQVRRFQGLGEEGFRVLAVAWRTVEPTHDHARVSDGQALTFAGFAAFLDPPKASAGDAIRALQALGVTVMVVSGDNERVTRHLLKELKLPEGPILLGREIEDLPEAALAARVAGVVAFCRVNPAQKARIIQALSRRGHTVGYLGDGINDAPSLHAADVGLSVEGAVDVAKEAADMILLEQDLGVLQRGVIEGRRTFSNGMKYILMATSSNFGNMASMAGAVLFLPFLPMLPLQILLNNLIYDLSEIAIPLDRVDPSETTAPSCWDMGLIRRFMLAIGPISSIFDFATFWLLLHVFQAQPALFHTGWFIESMATQILVIFVIRTRLSPWQSRPSPYLTATSLGCLALAIVLPLSPLRHWLGFVPPPGLFWAILPVMVGIYLALVEGVKRRFFRRLGA